jgi:hypothetical protein
MERKMRRASWLALGVLALAWDLATASVVGLRDSYEDVFVAVRGMVPAGTVVRGIQFYSNDATTFPEVLLASDGTGHVRLPRAGAALRSAAGVAGEPGYVAVEFPPYEATEAQYLWAIVRFPDRSPMLAAGPGGGPAIGWREERRLPEERSFFSVQGAVNEFSPAFDISLLTGQRASLEGEGSTSQLATAEDMPTRLDVRTRPGEPGGRLLFRLDIPRAGHLSVDLYSIAGHRVRRLLESEVTAGTREVRWDGRDGEGHWVARGVYLYEVDLGGERRTGKVVVWR